MPNEKLLHLADVIESRQDFNQDQPSKCVVGIGLEVAGIETDVFSNEIELFANHYGVTYEVADAIFWANYSEIFDDENDVLNILVDRFEAARILRRVARELA